VTIDPENDEQTPRQDRLPFLQLIPNMVTILGLCAGLTAIRFVIFGRFELAAALIIFAALIDGLDGLLARRLNAASDIGAQLDSLSDFLCFGVAPALLVFHMALGPEPGIGWIFVLTYASCACLRLARFNVMADKEPDPSRPKTPHFTGVPAPAGAMLALLPAFLSFQGVIDASFHPWLADFTLAAAGALMVSRLPTISPKAITVPKDKQVWILLGAALLVGILLTRAWLLMIMLDLAYIATLIWAARQWRKAARSPSA
jgi:CDP-diacylglycerol--serine O-phosphatidyltransferase